MADISDKLDDLRDEAHEKKGEIEGRLKQMNDDDKTDE